MKKLFEARPWYKLPSDQTLILNTNKEGAAYQKAALADEISYVFVPNLSDLPVRKIKSSTFQASFNAAAYLPGQHPHWSAFATRSKILVSGKLIKGPPSLRRGLKFHHFFLI